MRSVEGNYYCLPGDVNSRLLLHVAMSMITYGNREARKVAIGLDGSSSSKPPALKKIRSIW